MNYSLCNYSSEYFEIQEEGGVTLRWYFIRRKPFYHQLAEIGHGQLFSLFFPLSVKSQMRLKVFGFVTL